MDEKWIKVKVKLNFKPKNTKLTFTPERAVVNESVIITCDSHGLPEPNYNMTHNGIEVSTNKIYTIDDVHYRHAGTYKCVAKNKLGKDSNSANLIVIEKPNVMIINCPSHITVNEGIDRICACRSEGGNPLTNLTWYKDGVQIGKASYGENRLTLTSVARQDIGTYRCVAQSYTLTDEESIEVKVRLNFKPYNTKITITPQKAKVGESVTILCETVGLPEPNYNITHDRTMVTTGKTYTIHRMEKSDEGKYECIAWNKLGSDSVPKHLTVEKALSNDTEWYIVVVSLVSGIIIGILLSYIVSCSRRKFRSREPRSNTEAEITEVDSTYQELDLSKMNAEDNYQSLRINAAINDAVNENDSTYTELHKARDVENNYQSLT